MAIAPELRAQILRLYQAEHWRVGTVASQLHLHRDTVQRVLAQACVLRCEAPLRPSQFATCTSPTRVTPPRSPTSSAGKSRCCSTDGRPWRSKSRQVSSKPSRSPAPGPPRWCPAFPHWPGPCRALSRQYGTASSCLPRPRPTSSRSCRGTLPACWPHQVTRLIRWWASARFSRPGSKDTPRPGPSGTVIVPSRANGGRTSTKSPYQPK